MRFLNRWRARRRLRNEVGLWFHPEYSGGVRRAMRIPNVRPDRAERALEGLAHAGLVRPRHIRLPPTATFEDLALVHSREYLTTTTRSETLARIFGLAPEEVDVDVLLAAQRRAVGGTVAAARAAASGEVEVAFNLGGGFHHAEPEQGSGFCVYNDVAVAVALLRAQGFSAPVAIVDLDYHQGNGNMVAFAKDASVLTYSVQGAAWAHIEAVANLDFLLPAGSDDRAYLGLLTSTLPAALKSHAPGLIFFIAGADVLDGDPLGGFRMTLSGVLARDRFVTEQARSLRAPMVVTMAGGYSAEAHRATFGFVRWLLTGDVKAAPPAETDLRARFERIAASLDPYELQAEHDDPMRFEADVMAELMGKPSVHRILDFYSTHGVELALERYGLLQKVRKRGFSDLRIAMDPSDRERQRVSVHGRKGDGPHHLLVELVVRRATEPAPSEASPHDPLDLLSIEWMLLQDPTAIFSEARPRFPGQEHPGLGLVREIMEMLFQGCKRLRLDGLSVRP
ncbi:MAG: histone deacetylase, partial [Deltaproteobacteria bacterium]|nr:histone deacetylase [Deltaproteobacteria bacterium]